MTCPYLFRLHRVLCTVIAFACLVGIAAPAWGQFETRATKSLPGESFSAAAGDFNHDGKLDIAVMDGQVSILLGNGDGTFQAPVNYPSAPGLWIAAADFNNDGNLDLVTANGDNTVSVFLGNGDGTFQSPKISFTTNGCGFLAVGDFNGDHNMDIVVIDHPYVSVLLGNGDGTFQSPFDNSSFVEPQWLTVGDFNNDRQLDVAVVGSFGSSANIGVLLGNANGTLQDSLTYPLIYTPCSVAAADLNRDGKLDVAIGGCGDGFTVLLGNGDGSFQSGVTYITSGGGGPILAADFEGNGKLDLVFSAGIPPGLNESLGNGDGTFQPATFFPAGRFSGALAVGDFNNDHKPDVVYVDRTLGATTLLNTGALSFSPSTPLNFALAQLVGGVSPPKVVMIANVGSAGVSIRSIAASSQFQVSNTCAGEIAPGGKCSVKATLAPTTAGPHKGLITLSDSATSKPQVVEVSGRGTFVALAPDPMKFAPQKAGTKSAPQQLSITNEGSTSLTISTVNVGGTDATDFFLSETANCAGKTLAAGAACSVSVAFAPKKTGALSATVVVDDSGAGSPETEILFGTGK